MRRLSLIALVATVTACAKPAPEPAATLDSPSDVELVRVCSTAVLGNVTVEAWTPECAASDLSFALVTNRGNRFVHAIGVGSRSLGYIDYERAIPGETGIIVPDGPTGVEPLAHPTMAAVASHRDRSYLSVVEFIVGTRAELSLRGVPVGTKLELEEPIGILTNIVPDEDIVLPEFTVVDGSAEGSGEGSAEGSGEGSAEGSGEGPEADIPGAVSVLVGTLPSSRGVAVWEISAKCGRGDAFVSGCTPEAAIEPLWTLPLPSVPTAIAVRSDGRGWVAVRDAPYLYSMRLFGTPADDEACDEAPCLGPPMPVTWSCSDHIDDDGDGLVDADDPQCFGTTGRESGTELGTGELTACTNGLDDDGDGVADADDPGCRDAGDRSEGDGYDGVEGTGEGSGAGSGDGCVWPHAIPSQDGVAPTGLEVSAPRCSNGEDDDGDGATDWPDDTDCYGPNDDGEVVEPLRVVPDIALTEEGDYLVALERSVGQLLFFDADTNELVRVNELDRLHDTDGARALATFPGPIVTDTAVLVYEYEHPPTFLTSSGATTYTHWRFTERRVHIATTDGYADTVIIDRTAEAFESEPAADDVGFGAGPGGAVESVSIFRPFDLNTARVARISRVDCDIPADTGEVRESFVHCDDRYLPRPLPLFEVRDVCGSVVPYSDDVSYEDADPTYFAAIYPQRVQSSIVDGNDLAPEECADVEDFTPPESPVSLTTVPEDYAILGGSWDVVFEGVINGTERTDGLLFDLEEAAAGSGEGSGEPAPAKTHGWLRFTAGAPCDDPTNATFCGRDTFDGGACPQLETLCEELASSETICEYGYDVCELCPSACRQADFCAAGVMPGDIVEIDRLPSSTPGDECAPYRASTGRSGSDLPPLEYEVCSVAEGYLEVAVFETGCSDASAGSDRRAVPSFPPTNCLNEPLSVRVRSGGWLVRNGTRVGPSPYRAVDGRCVLATDAEYRVMRAVLDEPFCSEFGPTFTLADFRDDYADDELSGLTNAQKDELMSSLPYEIYPRDFGVTFDVDRNLAFRTSRDRQLFIGPATAGVSVGDTRYGHRIAIVDEGLNTLTLHRAGSTYSVAAGPLP